MQLIFDFFRPLSKTFIGALGLSMAGGMVIGIFIPPPLGFIPGVAWGLFMAYVHFNTRD